MTPLLISLLASQSVSQSTSQSTSQAPNTCFTEDTRKKITKATLDLANSNTKLSHTVQSASDFGALRGGNETIAIIMTQDLTDSSLNIAAHFLNLLTISIESADPKTRTFSSTQLNNLSPMFSSSLRGTLERVEHALTAIKIKPVYIEIRNISDQLKNLQHQLTPCVPANSASPN